MGGAGGLPSPGESDPAALRHLVVGTSGRSVNQTLLQK